MIDFRYHVVSLVSVFLALGIGIVLGAGPLQQSIGTTLAKDVDALRQEKDALRTELDTTNAALQHRDDFTTAVVPTLVNGQLLSRRVVIVALPGVDTGQADSLVNAITAAGGTVTGRVSIGAAWVDPGKGPARTKAISDLTTKLPTGAVPTAGATDVRLSSLLAHALVGAGVGPAGRNSPTASAVLGELGSVDLIAVKGDVAGLASGAILLAPGNPDSTSDQPTATSAPQLEYVNLATALDSIGGGAVVSGPPSSASGAGVLALIRNDDVAKSRVSTVDTGSTPMGVITAVLALREQLSGGAGAYGFGSGVSAPLPPLGVTVPTGTGT
jgi:hypothetical protein